MTKEIFKIANDIVADIDSLKEIKAIVKEQAFKGDIIRDNLKNYIDAEITNLETELEKL